MGPWLPVACARHLEPTWVAEWKNLDLALNMNDIKRMVQLRTPRRYLSFPPFLKENGNCQLALIYFRLPLLGAAPFSVCMAFGFE